MSLKYLYILAFLSLSTRLFAQDPADDLLSGFENKATRDYATNAFKSPRVINGNSIEMLPFGVLDFRILHRFGEISGGGYELFGLDQASMRMGLDYGFTKNFMAGIGRSTFRKEVDGFVKYRILWQSKGKVNIPISLIWASGMMVNGLKEPVPNVETTFSRRISYYHQLIIGRKFSDRFSLQVSPILVHQNITPSIVDPNDVFAVGIGGRWKFTKRVALTWDGYITTNKFANDLKRIPLSLGVDIETGGHVFQLHISNSTGMNERAFLLDQNGDWTAGNIRLGFNISRWFQIQNRKI
jgi:Membrane bound beta barrel domain (DUF5777)